MLRYVTGRRGSAGFSQFELMIVVGIGLVITAFGLPRMTTAIANLKLRASMTTVSGFLQNTRTLAVQRNKTKGPWWERLAGSFRDDPLFDEMIEAGRTYRQSSASRSNGRNS